MDLLSKAYIKIFKYDFNKANGWNILLIKDFERVSQIAIVENWSVLHLRKVT
jgi:hypothetical protein